MKVTYTWLKELVAIPASAEEVATRLTTAGLEVASLETRSIPEGVVVAEVVSCEKHPNADHLSLCTVSAGNGEPLTVVCGAPNVTAGMKSALATIGTELSPEFTVKKVSLRGAESSGMLCSERELGISDNHDGIIELSPEYVVGSPLKKYFEDDTVIEIDLTPNRGDCLSVIGIAREVAAQYTTTVKPFVRRPKESDDSIDNYIKVSIEDAEGCPRYMGRLVRGVTIKESPDWLKQRLSALDIRPICNVVDVTNYILLLYGQPMHSFDYAKIGGREIIIKRAEEGQAFVTLDDIERKLTAEDLLICDGEQPTALAGVMGGAGSGISEDTTDVFLECAFFDPVGIRKTSKRLDLSTDSSYRFERGVDPETGLVDALDMAADLICELAGGTVAKGVIDVYPHPIKKTQISLRPAQVSRLLGVPVEKETIIRSLASLGISCCNDTGEGLLFEAPHYRHDLKLEVDLIEEVGRLYGYDNIPARTDATVALDQKINHTEKNVDTIRKSLAAVGLHETVTNSMTSEKKCRLLTPDLDPVVLLNPLNPDMSRMRTTLLGSLLGVTAYNINRKNTNNGFFEIGKKYINRGSGKQPDEPDTLAILLEGDFIPASWNTEKQALNFYILKGIIESLRISLGLPQCTYIQSPDTASGFYTSETSQIEGQGIDGYCGKIKQDILQSFDIKTPVYYAELIITDLLTRGTEQPHYTSLPRYPAIERDFCFVMDEKLPSATISDEIHGLSELVESVRPFDVYRGEKLLSGKKSIAFSVFLRAEDRTLTDKEAEKVCEKIISTAKSKFNAVLREQ